jgi:hypothetical protein
MSNTSSASATAELAKVDVISLSERALLASIRKAGVPVTVEKIFLEWTPTWSLPEINLILSALKEKDLIQSFDKTGSGLVYFAAKI